MAVVVAGAPVGKLRNRRVAAAVGLTVLVHFGLFSLFAFSITEFPLRAPTWGPAFPVSLVREPAVKRRDVTKPAPIRSGRSQRARVIKPDSTRSADAAKVADPSTTSSAPVANAASPAPQAGSQNASSASTGSDADSRMRSALHGLAACHPYGVTPTDKERAACNERSSRLATRGPHIDAPRPPPAASEPEQKAGTCRLDKRSLLSAHVKCKFW
jgi:hypothetical protein